MSLGVLEMGDLLSFDLVRSSLSSQRPLTLSIGRLGA